MGRGRRERVGTGAALGSGDDELRPPGIPQLEFYLRLAQWVAPGGSLLIVGHRSGDHGHASHDTVGQPPHEATATVAGITGRLDPAVWQIETAADRTRTTGGGHGHSGTLHDVVVRATRRADDHQ